MYIKIQTSDLADGNTGSCRNLAYYLEKENNNKPILEQTLFFSAEKDFVHVEQVIQHIDQNGKGGIRKGEAKFYSIVIAPSQRELDSIGNDSQKLMAYTRQVMELYAENFNRGLTGKDIVWYAKIEQSRIYKQNSPVGKRNQQKEGLQTHIHVIVSRKTADKKKLVSPLANEKGKTYVIGNRSLVKGFDRNLFKQKSEELFDKMFAYARCQQERFEFFRQRSKSLSIKERIQLASAVQKQSSIQTQNMSSTEKNTALIQKYSEKETPKKSQFNQRHEDSNTYLNWLMEMRKKAERRKNLGKKNL